MARKTAYVPNYQASVPTYFGECSAGQSNKTVAVVLLIAKRLQKRRILSYGSS